MRCLRSTHLALVAALALSGCSYTDNVLDWATGTTQPTNTSTPTSIPIAPSQGEINSGAVTATPLPAATAASSYTGGTTIVGTKAQSLRAELAVLQGNLGRHQQELAADRQSLAGSAQTYFTTIASINARLQAGTTPGNPQLVAQWGQAQSILDQMDGGVARLNSLSNQAASDASYGNYLLNEVRSAYNLQGGVEADRDALHQIEAQTTAALAQADQLLNGLSNEITRQGGYVTGERNNLVTLALAIQNGQLYGPSLANRNFTNTPASAPAARPAPAPRAAAPAPSRATTAPVDGDSRPLVVIRFDQANVDYEQPLYTAVSRALERKPSATFTIQAVAPNAGSAADVAVNTNASRQNAENVLRSLTNMGLPADRVSLSATMSPDISSNEVRVFVR